MTLKAYSAKIAAMAKKHPNALVVYSHDDEGNFFQEVNDDFGFVDKFDRITGEWDESGKTTAACIN